MSLQALVRPGTDQVVHKTTATARLLNVVLRDRLSALDYGSTGDGVLRKLSSKFTTLAMAQVVYPFATSLEQSLDWAGIQAVIHMNRNCYVPTGTYQINSSIVMSTSVSVSGESNGIINRPSTFLQMQGNIACFLYGESFASGEIQHFYIYFGNKPATTTGNDGKIGVLFNGGATSPGVIKVSHVDVDGAFWGFYDNSGNYLAEFETCWVRRSMHGFYKANGTTINWRNCYCMDVNSAWYVVNCSSPQWSNCGADGVTVDGSNYSFESAAVYLQGCKSFVINGWAGEANIIKNSNAVDSAYLKLVDCLGTITGMYGHGTSMQSTLNGANIAWISCLSNSKVSLHDSNDSFLNDEAITYTGTGAFVTSLYADATSKLFVHGGRYKAPVGGAPAVSTAASGNVILDDTSTTGLLGGSVYYESRSSAGLSVPCVYTAKGSKACAAGVSTALFDLPSKDGAYLITVYAPGSGNNYTAMQAAVVTGGTVFLAAVKAAPFLAFASSGYTVGVTSSGNTTVNWTYTMIG